MKTIKVNEIISSAFSQQKALVLREKIEEYLKQEDRIVLDFKGITKFTTLFFNFSTGYYISLLRPEEYNKKIELINLSELGNSVYQSSYENAAMKYEPGQITEDEIINIIKNPED